MRWLWIGLVVCCSVLIGKPWGTHAIVKDPKKSSLYLQWFDRPGQGALVKIREKGAELSTEEKPTEIAFGSSKWHLYRLQLTLTPKSVWKVELGEESFLVKSPPKSLPLKLAIGGDMFRQKGRFRRMNEVVQEENPDLIVMGGDLAYALDGAKKAKAFKVALEQWENFFLLAGDELKDPEGALIPWFVVVGNHDFRNDDAGELFFKFFPFENHSAKHIVDFEGLSIIGLDSGHAEPIAGAQTDWLKTQLEERKSVPWKIAAYHIGAYPAYYSYKGETPDKIRNNWCPLFETGGVIAAFEHHSHCYKRTFPLIHGVVSPKGVTYFGDGCWGVLPRKYTFDALHFAKAARINHVYIVDVYKDHMHVKAVNDEGEVFDGAQFTKNTFKKS